MPATLLRDDWEKDVDFRLKSIVDDIKAQQQPAPAPPQPTAPSIDLGDIMGQLQQHALQIRDQSALALNQGAQVVQQGAQAVQSGLQAGANAIPLGRPEPQPVQPTPPSDTLTNPLGRGNAPIEEQPVRPTASAGTAGAIPAEINVPVNQGPSISRQQVAAALQGTALDGYGDLIYSLGQKYNVDPAFALSVARNESNYGASPAQAQNNNIFSISNALYGGSPTPGSRWGQYPSKEAGIEAFFRLIASEYYPNQQTTVGSIMWGPQGSQTHAYAPTSENSPDYPNRLLRTMADYGARDITPPTPSDTLTNPLQTRGAGQSQFGDRQLTAAEAEAACGPAAAVTFARLYGRNPTLREATDMAAQVGWNQASGMAGITSEQRLLRSLGVDSRLVNGGQWDEFARHAATGNPVILSTPGHYFVATGYDPATKKFYVGASGSDLRRGSAWMSPAEMEGLMGGVQGGLVADHPVVGGALPEQETPSAVGGVPPTQAENPLQGGLRIVERQAAQVVDAVKQAGEGAARAFIGDPEENARAAERNNLTGRFFQSPFTKPDTELLQSPQAERLRQEMVSAGEVPDETAIASRLRAAEVGSAFAGHNAPGMPTGGPGLGAFKFPWWRAEEVPRTHAPDVLTEPQAGMTPEQLQQFGARTGWRITPSVAGEGINPPRPGDVAEVGAGRRLFHYVRGRGERPGGELRPNNRRGFRYLADTASNARRGGGASIGSGAEGKRMLTVDTDPDMVVLQDAFAKTDWTPEELQAARDFFAEARRKVVSQPPDPNEPHLRQHVLDYIDQIGEDMIGYERLWHQRSDGTMEAIRPPYIRGWDAIERDGYPQALEALGIDATKVSDEAGTSLAVRNLATTRVRQPRQTGATRQDTFDPDVGPTESFVTGSNSPWAPGGYDPAYDSGRSTLGKGLYMTSSPQVGGGTFPDLGAHPEVQRVTQSPYAGQSDMTQARADAMGERAQGRLIEGGYAQAKTMPPEAWREYGRLEDEVDRLRQIAAEPDAIAAAEQRVADFWNANAEGRAPNMRRVLTGEVDPYPTSRKSYVRGETVKAPPPPFDTTPAGQMWDQRVEAASQKSLALQDTFNQTGSGSDRAAWKAAQDEWLQERIARREARADYEVNNESERFEPGKWEPERDQSPKLHLFETDTYVGDETLDALNSAASYHALARGEQEVAAGRRATNQSTFDLDYYDPINRFIRDVRDRAAKGDVLLGHEFQRELGKVLEPNGTLPEQVEAANRLLSDAGYDGLQYAGGTHRAPMRDPTTGDPITHRAIMVFPEHVDRVTNAFTGTAGGKIRADFAAGLGGAAALGAAGAAGFLSPITDAAGDFMQRARGDASGDQVAASLENTDVVGRLGRAKDDLFAGQQFDPARTMDMVPGLSLVPDEARRGLLEAGESLAGPGIKSDAAILRGTPPSVLTATRERLAQQNGGEPPNDAELADALRARELVETAATTGTPAGGVRPLGALTRQGIRAAQELGPTARAEILKDLGKADWWDKVNLVRMSSMLGSTATQLTNIAGNVTSGALALPEHALASGFDRIAAATRGTERTRYMGELGPMFKAWGPGILDGLKDATQILKGGLSPDELAGMGIRASKLGTGVGPLDTAVEIPLRALAATDVMMRRGAFSAYATGAAYRKAFNEGLKGAQATARAEGILADLGSYDDVVKEATSKARRAVFQEDRNIPLIGRGSTGETEGAERIAQAAVNLPIPFVKTPTNVLAQGLGHTPGGYGSVVDALRKGNNGEAADRFARATFGTGVLAGATVMGANGNLTADYPTGAARDSLPEGWKPWSVRITDPSGAVHYVPMQYFGPLGAPLAIGAAMGEQVKGTGDYSKLLDSDTVPKVLKAIGGYMLDSSFLGGLQDIVDFVENPGGAASVRYIQNMAGTFAPLGGLGREIQDVAGVPRRQPREGAQGFIDNLLLQYPGAAGIVPEKTNAYGEPTRGSTGWEAVLGRTTTERDTPLKKAMRESAIGVPDVPDAVRSYDGEVKLTESERDEIKRAIGARVTELGEARVADPDWDTLTPAGKDKILRGIVERAAEAARKETVSQWADRPGWRERVGEIKRPEPYYVGPRPGG
jgi:hypothetical protein